jgi:hypothetical protein
MLRVEMSLTTLQRCVFSRSQRAAWECRNTALRCVARRATTVLPRSAWEQGFFITPTLERWNDINAERYNNAITNIGVQPSPYQHTQTIGV